VKLSILMRLRIAAACAVGIVLIGFLAWPLASPKDPLGTVFMGTISFSNAAVLIALAVLTGFIAYFVSWPYGREIGILAVPVGLAIWAIRSGTVTSLMLLNPTVDERQNIFVTFKGESFFWLAVVAGGFLGVMIGHWISRQKPVQKQTAEKSGSKSILYLNAAIALIGSVLIAQFFIGIVAQDFRISDSKLGSVMAQPSTGQIIFAVLVAFGMAAFLVKLFLDASYIWPVISSTFTTILACTIYVKKDILQYLISHYPAVFFSNAVVSILPIQMVALGAIGSVAGYWLAIRFNYWRKYGI
jgi:hypothetical protein